MPERTLTDRQQLGRTPLQVTALGLGTAPLGGLYEAVEEDSADAVVQTAWDRGIRFFDTAPQYGHGNAERRLGRNLQDKPRDEFVLATKVGRLLRPQPLTEKRYYFGTPDEIPVFDFSYDGVMRSVDESLSRLGLDRVDILHIHDPDDHPDEALGGALKALIQLRSEGTISAVGAGMNQAEMLTRFAQTGEFDCFLLAGRYTLLEQNALDNLLPAAKEHEIAIIAGGVYNSGLLANPTAGTHYNYDEAPPELLERAQALQRVCEDHGVPLRAAAIQFAGFHPAIPTVLTGPRGVDELIDTCELHERTIPNALWAELKQEGLLRRDAPTP
jgi:D-threo-aldose 1-dehydrogenase